MKSRLVGLLRISALMAACVATRSPVMAACDFAIARVAIDNVLDKDHEKAKAFRKEFAEGTDPFTILDGILDAEAREKIDECRFPAAEYLTKRGFPPSH